jgi:hypothetical protein
MLSRIHIGWHWLDQTLNTMIDAINEQKPVGSASIAVEESPNGTLLKVVGAQADQTSGGGGGGGGASQPNPPSGTAQWCQLAVIDNSSGTCVTKHLWYWGTPAS